MLARGCSPRGSQPRLRRRPSRHRRRAGRDRAHGSSTCTVSTRTSRCCDPAVQRGALDRYAGPDGARRAAPRTATTSRRGSRARRRARRHSAVTRAAAGPRDRPAALPGRRDRRGRLEDPAEDVALEAEEALLADAVAHRAALTDAYEALEGPASDAVGPGARRARRPRAVRRAGRSSPRAAGRARRRRAGAAPRGRPGRGGPGARRRRCAPAAISCTISVASTASTLADVIAYGAEVGGPARRSSRPTRTGRRRSRPTARRARDRGHGRPPPTWHGGAPSGGRAAGAGDRGPPPRAGHAPRGGGGGRSSRPSRPTTGTTASSTSSPPIRGRPPARSARAASGGELSRAMLATRVVLSEAPPTLVFDEVDAGIGGEAGVAVGRLLQTLGSRHQVLCVTHLAQVAAFADTQVVVEKTVELSEGRGSERTVAHAAVVDGDDRVTELSRMLAGIGDSSHAAPSRGRAARRPPRRSRADCADGAPAGREANRCARRDPGRRAGRPPHQGHDPAPAGRARSPSSTTATSTASRPTASSSRASSRW